MSFDVAQALSGLTGVFAGAAIVGVVGNYVVSRLKQQDALQEKRLAKVEIEVAAMAQGCAGCRPQVQEHEEQLKTVNVALLDERIARSLNLGLRLEERVEPLLQTMARLQASLEAVRPEVEDLRKYVRNVSRKSDRKDFELERRICRLEGRECPPRGVIEDGDDE